MTVTKWTDARDRSRPLCVTVRWGTDGCRIDVHRFHDEAQRAAFLATLPAS